jgi:hypothetical protein
MKWRYLDTDPITGAKNFHGYDHDNKRTIIRTEYDKAHLQAIRDSNTRDANDHKFKFLGKDEGDGMRHVARIGPDVVAQWLAEGVNIFDESHWPEVKKRLNDPQWRKLRTSSENI